MTDRADNAAHRREINLDAARAERAAQKGEPPYLILDGERYDLPVELPTDFIELVMEDRLRDAIKVVLGAKADAFLGSKGLSVPDWEFLADELTAAYGLKGGLGNLRPSGG